MYTRSFITNQIERLRGEHIPVKLLTLLHIPRVNFICGFDF